MKLILPIILALACIALALALYTTNKDDTAQHETDAGAIADYSNKLASAEMKVALREGTLLTFSNRVEESLSGALVFSNQLMEAHVRAHREQPSRTILA